MSKYQQFVFERYEFSDKTLKLFYGYDDQLHFCETFTFDFDFATYDPVVLDRALQLLFFIAGVSYFKMYMAPQIVVQSGEIDAPLAQFLSKTYQKGLGEFFYVNKLDPLTSIEFPATATTVAPLTCVNTGVLLGIGGGKDSLVSVEALRDQPDIATWSVNHQAQLTPLIKTIGLPHYWVERSWDAQIPELNAQDALNGHIPVSAIFAAIGTVVAVLSGKRDVVVSNENSANEPTLMYENVAINHQYSKSLEFEQDFQACLSRSFGDSLRYYSVLRPFSELRIAELFAQSGFEKYQKVFSSCNRAYRHGENSMSWCGECSKCAFVCLALAPFVPQDQLTQLWGGKNLLLDSSLRPTYEQLLGISGDKPLDCVGEIKESRAAMRLVQEQYPELKQFDFELPSHYDYRSLAAHSMPPEIFTVIEAKLAS